MISIRGLTKWFDTRRGRVEALRGIDLEVAEKEFCVLLGPSGCGKTTTLRCVAGLERPDAGELQIAGTLANAPARGIYVPTEKRDIGMVFQSYAIWPHMNVFNNVAFPLIKGRRKIPRDQITRKVHDALKLVQLDGLEDRPATDLSGGQQQRVAMARAIVTEPKILLMDEPLSNLDARLREEVRGKIRELAKQLSSTVLYVTHDQIEAMAMSDKIALMQSGELLQVGRPMELYHRPARAEVAEFFGSVNWLKGKIVGSSLAETPIGRLGIRECARPGEDVLVGFRPEALTVVEDHRATDSNVLQATLRTSTFLGDQFIYRVEVRDQSLVGKGRSIPAQKDGKLYLYVHPEDVMVFPAGQKTGLTVLEQTTHPV